MPEPEGTEPTTTVSVTTEPKSFTQDQVNAMVAEAKRKASEKFANYGDLKTKAEQFDALQEQNKTEVQKATERAEQAERRAQEAEARSLKADVAIAKGVPVALLSGTTKEELEAAADALLAFRGEATPPPPATVKIVTPGQSSGRPASVAQVMADRAAAREAKTQSNIKS
jgi:dihydroorotase-like cyclic amidohydrolase